MQLSVKGKPLDIGDAMRTHVRGYLPRTLGWYLGDAIEIAVPPGQAGKMPLSLPI